MKSFKQFLQEMPALINLRGNSTKESIRKNSIEDLEDENASVESGEVRSRFKGHSVHVHEKPTDMPGINERIYHVRHGKTGKLLAYMAGDHEPRTNTQHVSNLGTHPDKDFKGHEFYHHLLHHHCDHLVSDNRHTLGASHVWKKLSKTKGIKVRKADGKRLNWRWKSHYNPKTGSDIRFKASRVS